MYPHVGGEIEFLIFKNCLYRAYCISLYNQGFTRFVSIRLIILCIKFFLSFFSPNNLNLSFKIIYI